jgi:hypoxanthine phosphoribosyltransferase
LTFYRVRWAYEPTTFPLAFGDEGRPSEMFTPDFYLPEHRLYIELTTMRQRLVTRKNRKIRRLRELYPQVRIKLLYRRDYDRLVDAYRPTGRELAACRVGRVLFDQERIRGRVAELAVAIAAGFAGGDTPTEPARPDRRRSTSLAHRPYLFPLGDGAGEQIEVGASFDPVPETRERDESDCSLLVLEVDRGSAVFTDHLAGALDAQGAAIARDRVTLTRYRTPHGERRVRLGRGPRLPFAGRDVLLVADCVSTGLSLAYLRRWLLWRGARRVEVCALLDRRSARLVEVPVRYIGFEAPNELLVGFGLHLRRQFRDLPFIAALALEPAPEPVPTP